jgi:hypothetical protein
MVETWLLTKDTFVEAGKLAIEETVFRWQVVEGSNKETLTETRLPSPIKVSIDHLSYYLSTKAFTPTPL